MTSYLEVQKPEVGKLGGDVLVVDLDGTLIRNDLFFEGLARLAIRSPLKFVIAAAKFLVRGKASAKKYVAEEVEIEVERLPYRPQALQLISDYKATGRDVWLATGQDRKYAVDVARHIGKFSKVLASDGVTNLTGKEKRKKILEELGPKDKYVYLGDSNDDLSVFHSAEDGIIFTGSKRLALKATKLGVMVEFDPPKQVILKHIRFYQWVKNFLIFIPLITAHDLGKIESIQKSFLAFAAFSFAASAVYGINDLSDIWADRRAGGSKSSRMIASGRINPLLAVAISIFLVAFAFALAANINEYFSFALAGYLALTVFYTFLLKRIPIADTLALSFLYNARIVAGAFAISVNLSFWIISFSIFLFTALAFLKRFVELKSHEADLHFVGRGYVKADIETLRSLGTSVSTVAIVIFALYINDTSIRVLYERPDVLWIGVPILLSWLSWLWLVAGRGKMNSDPIFFALRDKVSILCGLLMAIAFAVAL